MAFANATTKENISITKILMKQSNLIYLRALNLKQREPEKWRKMMELPGADKYKSLEEGDEDDKWFVEEILPLLEQIGDLTADFLKVKGILKMNGYDKVVRVIPSSPSTSTSSSQEMVFLFYLQTSLIAHACFPNSCKTVSPGPEFRKNVITALEVKKGEIISICYGENIVIAGAIKRQHTEEFGSSLCHCPRCVDPTGTELGSMLSAVKCTEKGCKEGYLLPVDPLDMDMEAAWKCNGSEGGCKGASTWKEVDEVVSKLEALIPDVQIDEFGSVKPFLEKLKSQLHPNHWVLMRFQDEVTNKLNIKREPQLTYFRIELHISMLDDLLRMTELTSPGSSLAKGYLLMDLFVTLCSKLKTLQFSNPRKGVMSKILKVTDELLPIAKLYPFNWDEEELNTIKSVRDKIVEIKLKCP